MANRYWVGGTDNWDATAGTKWSLTSGGAGGQAVPTAADDVFFDAASGAVTCTISAGNTGAKSIDCTGFTGTLAGVDTITISGNVTLVTGMSFTFSGITTINGNSTITSAGKTFPRLIISGTGITVNQADALTISSSQQILISEGTFNTNNFNLSCGFLFSLGSLVRALNLGSSTVTTSFSDLSNFSGTNFTFNAGTSTIVHTASTTASISNTGSYTFYNVQFTGTGINGVSITGNNTFNNLSFAGPSAVGNRYVTFANPCTINGTLSTTGTAGNRRLWFRGVTYGIAQTLTINSAPSLTDADFRDIYVIGTSAPISGTRIGNLAGCRGITFDVAKTVYWVTLAGGNWSGNNWSNASGGGASTDYFPLAQDTATFVNTGLNTSATITLDAAMSSTGLALSGVDMSARTNAMTLNFVTSVVTYGDWKNGSGTTLTTGNGLTFSGRNTQTITSNGRSFAQGIIVDSYGGTVQLADAFTTTSTITNISNGTFDTKGYALTATAFTSNNTNVRTINLGASTLTISGDWNTVTSTNLTLNAGTSTINFTTSSSINFNGGGLTYYNINHNLGFASAVLTVSGVNVFNNFSVTAPSASGLVSLILSNNQTINGTLTVAGATAIRRLFVRSDTLGTTRTLTANTLSATDCDFRDITLAGTAAGSSPTRAGNCGGNTGITFPAAKTVYWNLAGSQNWSATAWCPSSGGTPDINQFPLAQDTAVFDNAGSAGTISIISTWNIGTFDASLRTSAMTFTLAACQVYGNWKHGSGLTFPAQGAGVDFFGNGVTQTITSNGVSFGGNRFRPNALNGGKIILADAFTSSGQIQHNGGEFDANGFNVTASGYESNNTVNVRILRMGGGLWTLSGTGSIWSINVSTTFTFYKSTSNIVLSDTSTSARNFSGGGLSYNKLTIGGATGTATLTFNDGNQFTELASTKTVAHTINFLANQTFGAWTVSGTAGNVVTVSGTAAITIAGARVSGVDYLALGTTTMSTTSPAEFYAGANSTGGTRFILTAAPTPVTRYWVGGTGTWDATTTTNWSDTSGGSGGFSVPTSADAVIFDTLSNATAYTVTCTATQLRCGALTMAGPLVGNVTWAGSAPLAIHNNVSFAATGITRSYFGDITLTGSTTGRTFTTNGISLGSSTFFYVNGIGSGWSLGSALDASGISAGMYLINGSFDTAGYALSLSQIFTPYTNTRSLTFGASTVTLSSASGLTASTDTNLTINAGTSTILMTAGGQIYTVSPTTFYNVTWTNTSTQGSIYGINTFNNVTFSGRTSAGVSNFYIRNGTQTINGTLSITAGTNATMRTFIQSDVVGSSRSFVVNAFSGTDADFRDITVTGTAAPISGTRLGDCKGNSGITFDAGVTRYWNLAGGGSWGGSIGWAITSGGSPAINNFPLAQDTAVFETTGLNSGATVTLNTIYNIGTINMSARTSNTMTLAMSSSATIYGNWINGTGTILSGISTTTFAGRGSQTITSAGVTWTQGISINTPSGFVTLQDAFTNNRATAGSIDISAGTFNANSYNVTLTGGSTSVNVNQTTAKTLAINSGTWTIAGSGGWNAATSTNLTVTGTGTISLTSASAKNFQGGSISYSGITLNQGGAGTLTITGNNTLGNITNTYSATGATTINLSTTTQTVGAFTATGTSGKVLTIQGSSASNPATLIFSGVGVVTPPATDFLTITGVRAYNLATTWYAGASSTNNGSLGWIFETSPGGAINAFIIETSAATDVVNTKNNTFKPSIAETATATDTNAAFRRYSAIIAETTTATDATRAVGILRAFLSETATITEAINAPGSTYKPRVAETATATDTNAAKLTVKLSVAETASITDANSAKLIVRLQISETATATDSTAAKQKFAARIAEIATALDITLVAPSTFNAPVKETATATDTPRASVVFPSFFADAVLVFDTMGGAYLWNPIDDSQTPNWQNINNIQSPGWTDINDSQNPGWTDIFTPNN